MRGKGPQENLDRESEIRTGGGAGGGGGVELLASQDEPQEEDAGDQAPAEDEEEPATVEWVPEGEHEEDEEARQASRRPATRVWVLTVMRSFPSYRPQTGRMTTRGASGSSDTIQTTATSEGSIKLLWETPCLPASNTIGGEIDSAPFLS